MIRLVRELQFAGDYAEVACPAHEIAERSKRWSEAALASLLAGAVEVSEGTVPVVWRLVKHIAVSLRWDRWRAFVQAGSGYSASCFIAPGSDPDTPVLVLSLSSGLVRDFGEESLRFVIGHEFGHAVLGHHGYPRPETAESESESGFLRELNRAAEFSADRVGLALTGEVQAAVDTCFRLASGLPEGAQVHGIGDFINQVQSLGNLAHAYSFEADKHPPLPLRAYNLHLIGESVSDWKRVWSGAETLDIDAIDQKLFRAISLVRAGDGQLGAAPWVELAVFWAVVAVFAADGRYSASEQAWMQRRFGERRSLGARRFMEHFRSGSVARALAKFREACPRILDSRRILAGEVEAVLREAATVAGVGGKGCQAVLAECIAVLESGD